MQPRPWNRRALIVHPDAQTRRTLERILGAGGYGCTAAPDAVTAGSLLSRGRFDLLLCGAALAGGSTADLVHAAQRDDDELVSVVVAAIDEVERAERALERGAFAYVLEPLRADSILQAALGALDSEGHCGGTTLGGEEASLRRVCDAIEVQFAGATGHVEHVSELTCRLGERLAVPPSECVLIRGASALHDIGNVTLPAGLLATPGELSEDERVAMRGHAEAGFRMLAGTRSVLLQRAATIAWTHHERWDGSGYPRGLGGEEIPLTGRITAVADVFDSLTRYRPYRPRRSADDALAFIRDGRSSAFDPAVVDALDAVLAQLKAARDGARGSRLRLAAYDSRPAVRTPPLTPREREVLQLAADGLSTLEIASTLVVSPGTVKTHFQNLYAKLGAINRASAVATALRRGIVV